MEKKKRKKKRKSMLTLGIKERLIFITEKDKKDYLIGLAKEKQKHKHSSGPY